MLMICGRREDRMEWFGSVILNLGYVYPQGYASRAKGVRKRNISMKNFLFGRLKI
jgi:hypothetical protein